ncbi:WXG100 family type VII secretion target [Streptomyces sp. NBC_01255]|uniref:WXG100 family type VII secretion target n=1 Tax=Streptomyces sp. NBC_01255 TaxID=2903798 RepID=UPI002E35DC87|nr:WXG100 family type VII secretion target [Streptomyces sp. NBC_01255]
MSHQQMLAWLDEASSFYVGDAATRLKSVSTQLEEIAAELKASMDRMDWEGEAEKAFAEWAANVANSIKGLADYSERGAVWMADNSSAIASAQSAMPRYTSHASAKENLEAALKYRNDPDSRTIAGNTRSQMAASEELDAIKAKEEANREAAAAEMERLSSAYSWSSSNMRNNVPPTFPPPPGAFVPPDSGTSRWGERERSQYPTSDSRTTGTDTRTGTDSGRTQPDSRTTPDSPVTPPTGDRPSPTDVVKPGDRPDVPTDVRPPDVKPDVPVDLGIDNVDTLPPQTPTTTGPGPTQNTPPPITKDGGTPPYVTTGMPPFPSKSGPGPLTSTPPISGGGNGNPRGPVPGSQRTGLGVPREGISGGRQVQSTHGRPATGIPRSTVIGTEQGGRNSTGMGRGPMGGGMGSPMGGGTGAGQNGISGGRRLAGETGGVVGGKAQRPGAAAGGARPFTPGGSGLVRGATTPTGREPEDTKGERPDYLVEDEETWQQGNRRVAPPVID